MIMAIRLLMSNNHHDADINGYGSLGARVTMAHLDLVQRAAEKEGIGRAEYIRNLVIPWAAADLGEGPPDMSIYSSQDDIKEAAKRAGMTVAQYLAHAAKIQAAKDLGKSEGPPRRVSEVRAALRAG